MTIRDQISRAVRVLVIIEGLGTLAFFVGCGIGIAHGKNLHWLSILGFFFAFTASLGIRFGVACPYCGNGIGRLIWREWLGLSDHAKTCPYCSKSLDSELSEDTDAS